MNQLLRCLLVLLLLASALPGRAQQPDPAFAPVDIWQSANIYSTETQPDGKLLVAGDFKRVNGRAVGGMVRLNADGTLDEAFTMSAAANVPITKVRRFPNGQLVVASLGSLTIGGRQFSSGVAELNADGTLVAGFDPGTGPSVGNPVQAIAVQADNKTLLGGFFSSFNGTTVGGLVRLNADGSVDQDFATNLGSGFAGGQVNALVVQADGKIVVGGRFNKASGYIIHSLLRLNANGTLDTGFLPFPGPQPNSGAQVLALALDPRTDQVVAYTSSLGSAVVRLTAAGQPDPTFSTPIRPNATINSTTEIDVPLAVDAAGGILLGGIFTSVGVQPNRAYLVRLLPTGQIDPAFVPQQLDDAVRNVRVLAGGEVLAGGDFARYGDLPQGGLLKLNEVTAQAQPAFRPTLDIRGEVASLAQQADGKLLLAGRFREINGVVASNLARLLPDGSLDATFALAGANGRVNKVLVLPNGRLLVGGRFTQVGSKSAAYIARLLTNGQADDSFLAPASTATALYPQVTVLALHTGGAVLGSGRGLNFGSNTSAFRLLPDGSLDQSYITNVNGQQLDAKAIAVLPDGRHYVLGSFTRPGTALASGVVRLNADGQLDPTFAFGTTSGIDIAQLAVQPDNKVLIGGSFYTYNGIARPNVARLNLDGSVDESFGVSAPGATPPVGRVLDLKLQPDGRVLVAGFNRKYGALYRLNLDGTPDGSFLGSNLYNDFVNELLLQPDGRIVTAGPFTRVDTNFRLIGLARLIAPPVLHVGAAQSAATLEAWPNPVRDQLNLRLNAAAGPRTVVLLSVLGREVYRSAATGARMQVPVGQLAAGVYLLRVEYAAGPVTRRVVVE